MANQRKLKQSTRTIPGRVQSDEPLARARRQHGQTPKKNSLHGTKRPRGENMPRVETAKERIPAGGARRVARIQRKSKQPAAAKTGRARTGSQAEKMATARSTRH